MVPFYYSSEIALIGLQIRNLRPEISGNRWFLIVLTTFIPWNPLAICPSVEKNDVCVRSNSKSFYPNGMKFYNNLEPVTVQKPILLWHSNWKIASARSKKPVKMTQNLKKVRLILDVFSIWPQNRILIEKTSEKDTSNVFLRQLEQLLYPKDTKRWCFFNKLENFTSKSEKHLTLKMALISIDYDTLNGTENHWIWHWK